MNPLRQKARPKQSPPPPTPKKRRSSKSGDDDAGSKKKEAPPPPPKGVPSLLGAVSAPLPKKVNLTHSLFPPFPPLFLGAREVLVVGCRLGPAGRRRPCWG